MFDTPEPDKWKWHVKAGILDVKQNCRTVIKLCYSRWVQYNCKSGNVIPCMFFPNKSERGSFQVVSEGKTKCKTWTLVEIPRDEASFT